jgi:hypothetical protein
MIRVEERTRGGLFRLPNRAGWASTVRRAVALGVVALLPLITPLGYLEQSDPLWIGGIWDDDDFDNVVAVVKSTEVPREPDHSVLVPLEVSTSAPPTAPEWRPIPLPVGWPENRAPPDA